MAFPCCGVASNAVKGHLDNRAADATRSQNTLKGACLVPSLVKTRDFQDFPDTRPLRCAGHGHNALHGGTDQRFTGAGGMGMHAEKQLQPVQSRQGIVGVQGGHPSTMAGVVQY